MNSTKNSLTYLQKLVYCYCNNFISWAVCLLFLYFYRLSESYFHFYRVRFSPSLLSFFFLFFFLSFIYSFILSSLLSFIHSSFLSFSLYFFLLSLMVTFPNLEFTHRNTIVWLLCYSRFVKHFDSVVTVSASISLLCDRDLFYSAKRHYLCPSLFRYLWTD
jgi:hypothetical protein